MDNKRKHTRHPVAVNIKISHPDIGEKIVKTKDISDGGLFILVEPADMPAPGSIVQGQVQGMMEAPPVLMMEVVRIAKGGLGLRYVLDELSDDLS